VVGEPPPVEDEPPDVVLPAELDDDVAALELVVDVDVVEPSVPPSVTAGLDPLGPAQPTAMSSAPHRMSTFYAS
jgi:hypothetical protein